MLSSRLLRVKTRSNFSPAISQSCRSKEKPQLAGVFLCAHDSLRLPPTLARRAILLGAQAYHLLGSALGCGR